MKLDQQYPPYYDGRNVEQIAVKIEENQKSCHTVVVKPEIPEGMPVQLRYPHSLELQS
ncbi:hypothetical protein [Neobacillus cucumis]|uniref:hypothetical protein n=1 Tax=Neobacillus cucumis TaxID=1740721 RepID=UPI00285304F9|nr:hypothetical protein [Neobacillus cucumis]MDR4949745.1 hypothetical protein [Neobacillus cucumis]